MVVCRVSSCACVQCGLVVAGLWGIILFHELKGKQLIGYWASTGAEQLPPGHRDSIAYACQIETLSRIV